MLRTEIARAANFRGKQFVTPFSVARLLHVKHFSQTCELTLFFYFGKLSGSKIPNSTRQCKRKNWTRKSLNCNGGASFRLGDTVRSPVRCSSSPTVEDTVINAQRYYPKVKICLIENFSPALDACRARF